jgi:hypothetical protein
MPTTKHTVEWAEYVSNLIYANTFYLCFLNGASAIHDLGRNPKQNFFAAELTDANYQRIPCDFTTGSYDEINRRFAKPSTNMLVQPETSLQYDLAFLLAGGVASSSAVATADSDSGQFSVPANGLNAGDDVLITADEGGALPTGVTSTIAHAKPITSTDFELYTEPALINQITFSTNGSGLRLRYAKGVVCLFRREDTLLTIAARQAFTFQGRSAVLNAGFVAGT